MRPSAPARHEALPYLGADDFVPTCHAAIRDALAGNRRVLLLAAEERLDRVRVALDDPTDEVAFVPTERHGRNPSRITALLDSFQSAGDGTRSLALTDWSLPSRSPAALAETQVVESLLNVAALGSWSLDLTCLYDAAALDDGARTDLRRVHPSVRGEIENPDYDAALFDALFAAPLADPVEVEVRPVGAAELSATRDLVRAYAVAGGLADERVEDLVVAANEIVTNSIRHGGGTARIALWNESGSVVCQVADTGRITDPLAGRLAPLPTAGSGRGLWLANQLCDLVQVRSSTAGTVVRLFVDRQ